MSKSSLSQYGDEIVRIPAKKPSNTPFIIIGILFVVGLFGLIWNAISRISTADEEQKKKSTTGLTTKTPGTSRLLVQRSSIGDTMPQPLKASCIYFHSKQGRNQSWLTPKYGNLVKAEFNENNRGWIDYEEMHSSEAEEQMHTWWLEHCRSVSHDYRNLAQEHVNAFVGPGKDVVMRFTFENGSVYSSDKDTEVFKDMFQLEEDYGWGLMGLEEGARKRL